MDLLYVLFVLSLVSIWSAYMLASATRRRSAINAIVDEAKLELEEGIRHIRGEIATVPSSTPRRFEAYTDCPKCGHLDHHWLREPHTEPVPDVPGPASGVALWESLFANSVMPPLEPGPPRMRPNPEAAFEVIRICTNCQHEWGQK